MEATNMATRRIQILALVVLLAAISGMALKLGIDDGGLCGMSQKELSECKPAVAAGAATPPPPSAACCAALGHADVKCLCTYKDNTYLPLFGINATLAMQLPAKCGSNENFHC